MTRWDRLLVALVAAAALASAPLAWAAQREADSFTVSGPAGVTRVPSAGDRRLVVVGAQGDVVVRIEGGEAWVERADCPDQVCVHTGRIAGGAIVCAPNGIVVRSAGDGDGYDARSR